MSGRRGHGGNQFAVLGLRADDDLSDDDVRAAWRRIAAATHPDRADGGDPDQFALAAAAYTELRTAFGRNEARANLRDRTGAGAGRAGGGWAGAGGAGAGKIRAGGTEAADALPSHDFGWAARIAERVRTGRPGRLVLRLAAAIVAAGVGVVAAGRDSPAAPALAVGALTWLLVTARHDLGG